MTVSRYSLGITLVGEVGVQTDSKELIHFPKINFRVERTGWVNAALPLGCVGLGEE